MEKNKPKIVQVLEKINSGATFIKIRTIKKTSEEEYRVFFDYYHQGKRQKKYLDNFYNLTYKEDYYSDDMNNLKQIVSIRDKVQEMFTEN